MKHSHTYTLDFSEIGMADLGRVGGKNASLGEMFNALGPRGVGVIDGFATTSDAYWRLLEEDGLRGRLSSILSDLDVEDMASLNRTGEAARRAVLETPFPEDLAEAIREAYRGLRGRTRPELDVAVRSSATAEDLPEASFAGAAETLLNVRGEDAVLEAVHTCMASLFTDRAINYRARLGFGQMDVALSVGVMPMVRSDLGSSGVIFTLDPETGFRDVIVITGAWGLGESVVQGLVSPDEWTVFKPTLADRPTPIIGRRLGTKEIRLVYGAAGQRTRRETTSGDDQQRFCLADAEVLRLARWALIIEDHYSGLAGSSRPMDVEWARDGITGELYIVQARPETVHAGKTRELRVETFRLTGPVPQPLVRGQAVGEKVVSGRVRRVIDPTQLESVEAGEVLVSRNTDPDWEPVMRRVAAIVTDQGGRTAHAAIVSREFGLPCIVGTTDATQKLEDGQVVTVSCCEGPEGHVYPGAVGFERDELDLTRLGATRTRIMMILGDPGQAFSLSALPNGGVGLARSEFIINNHIGIHPMALVRYPELGDPGAIESIAGRIGGEDPQEFFVSRFAEGIARIAAAFYPKPVIVRTSDFKTNEYARLIGGAEFEPVEENPMLGFRGASRYYDPQYQEGFRLECRALLRVRRDMGLTNVRVMIPFCRTPEEGRRVVQQMAEYGLAQGEDGLEVYAMCEIPSNVVLADAFLEIFDGLSIGSNDLTQLTLGIDRDSASIAHLFDERNPAVITLIREAVAAGQRAGKPVGICGQAPSDHAEFAKILVDAGIDSISLNPDVIVKTTMLVAELESARPAP